MFFGLPLVTFDGNLGSSLGKTRRRRDKWNHIDVITHKRMKIHPCVQTKYTQRSRREQPSQEQKAGWGRGQIDDGAVAFDRQQKWQRSRLLL